MACKLPCASKFRDRVTLQTKARASDDMGGSVDSWSDTATFWAKMTPLSANQRLYAKRLEHNVTHKLTTRYRSDISVSIDQRISWDNRIFQIQKIIDIDERKLFLEIECVEGQAT